MKRAGRVNGLRSLGVVAGLVALVLLAFDVRHRLLAKQEAVAVGLLERILEGNITQVPNIVRSMGQYRRWVDLALRQLVERSSERSSAKLRASLALLPIDDGQVDYLFRRLQDANADELPILREALKPHQAELTPKLWSVLDAAQPGDASLLPAASSLALYDPQNPRWTEVAAKVAEGMVTTNLVDLRTWLDALRPVRGPLTAPLTMIFRDKDRPLSQRTLATNYLTNYASDDPNLVADLLMDADPEAYAALFPIAKSQQAETLGVFRAELAKNATHRENAPALDKALTKPTTALAGGTDGSKDRLAQRQARAAVALVRLGKAEEVWPRLQHSSDPQVRSFIINWLSPLGADSLTVAAELARLNSPATRREPPVSQGMDAILFHPETSMRRALILALGTYGAEGLSAAERKPLTACLLEIYRDDPDAGIHGAAAWTLRQWGLKEKVSAVAAELGKLKDRSGRRWYANSQGQTFVVIDGPVDFLMGSPPSEPDRGTGERLHRRVIPRRYAIAANEVTGKQFQRFLRENITSPADHPHDPVGPQHDVTWYEAAWYCNWLSQQEGISEDQWCYEPNSSGAYAEGMRIKPNVLALKGYRLPTEAEWEYACRAGAATSRYYGASDELLERYAWYLLSAKGLSWPCGELLPNDLGLFDVLGNVHEWCQDEATVDYGTGKERTIVDHVESSEYIREKSDRSRDRILRGGAFSSRPVFVRSGSRNGSQPSSRGDANYGFRPARTLP